MPPNEKQAKIVTTFIEVFCRREHGPQPGRLCPQCADLLSYARQRLANCPFDPKPKCKKCPVHCYAEPYRSRIREVMKSSGIYFVKRGRVDWLIRYFLSR